MKRFLCLFVFAVAFIASLPVALHAEPIVKVSSSTNWSLYTVTFAADTDDSVVFGLGPSCSVRVVQYGGSGTVQLYQVPDTASATGSGTQVGSDFTAVSTATTTFQPGQRYARATASVASDGTVMEVWCSKVEVAGGGGVLGEGPLAEMDATTPSYGDLWLLNDSDGVNDDCLTGGGVGDLLCMYTNSDAWAAVPVSGSGDNLGSGSGAVDLALTGTAREIILDERTGEPTFSAGKGQIFVGNEVSNTLKFLNDDSQLFILSGESTFYVENYGYDASVSTTFLTAINAALAACETAEGGTVILPNHQITMNMATGPVASPAINLPDVLDSASNPHGACELRGYGRGQNGQTLSDMTGGSSLRFSNMSSMTADADGNKVAIKISAPGQVVRDFNIGMHGTDANSIGILCQSESDGTTEPGETSVTEVLLSGMVIAGPASGGPGKGVEFQNCQESVLTDSAIRFQDSGVRVAPVPCIDDFSDVGDPQTTGAADGLCDRQKTSTDGFWASANNATVVRDTTIRASDILVEIGAFKACEHFTLTNISGEASTTSAVDFHADALCHVRDFGSRYEPTSGNAIQADAAGGSYTSYSAFYGGSSTYDYQRTVAQTASHGPDIMFDAEIYNDINMTAGDLQLIGTNWFPGSISGAGAAGALQIDAGLLTDRTAAEAITAAWDFSAGTLIAEDDAACTANTQGALCVPTGTDNLFVGGTQVTGGGSGATTLTSGVVHPTTSATEDFAVGGTTSSADFFVDAATGDVTSLGDVSVTGDVGAATGTFTGAVTAASFAATPSAAPNVTFKDLDMAGTQDDNIKILGNCPTGTTAGGDEDCDITVHVQSGGVETGMIFIDTTDAAVTTVNFGSFLTPFGTAPTNRIEVSEGGVLTSAGSGSIAMQDANDTIDLETVVVSNIVDDEVFVGSGAGAGAFALLPDCNSAGNALNYDQATNAWSCLTGLGAGGTVDSIQGDGNIATTGAILSIDGGTGITTAVSGDILTITGHTATTDTGPSPDCAGTTTYQDGEGGCDDISTVYEGTLTNSAGLAAALSDENGSAGGFVRATSPTLTTPALGTPSALVLTNASGSLSLADGTVTASVPTEFATAATIGSPTEDEMGGKWFYVTTAGRITLPDITESGHSACFYSLVAGVVILDSNTDDHIRLTTTLLTKGNSIDSAAAIGDFICLMGRENTTADEWIALGRSGTWIDGGT